MPKKIVLILLGLAGLIAGLPTETWAQQQAIVFAEDFDDAVPPALPVGWNAPEPGWQTNESVASPGSGLVNLTIRGTTPAQIYSPNINLASFREATLSYLVRRTSSYDQIGFRIRASIDGGISFPITVLDAGEALPTTDGEYLNISIRLPEALQGQSAVVICFEALGGTTTGANIRLDDLLIQGDVFTDIFRFAGSEATISDLQEATIVLALDYSQDSPLQGLQFDLEWDNPLVSVTRLTLDETILPAGGFTLSYEQEDSSMRAVLIGDSTLGVQPGSYNPFLKVEIQLENTFIKTPVSFRITNVIGARAVPEGSDASIAASSTPFLLYPPIESVPGIVFSDSLLNFGTVIQGTSDTLTFAVSNPGEQQSLEISSIDISDPAFIIQPGNAGILPGDTVEFEVVIFPDDDFLGEKKATLIFNHNAPEETDTVFVQAEVVPGRGDLNKDAVVDIQDLVILLDMILGRLSPATDILIQADLHPFGTPDGQLDVRDLTVMAQAIVRGAWPDGLSLPDLVQFETPGTGGKKNALTLKTDQHGDKTVFYLEHDIPIRGMQLFVEYEQQPDLVQSLLPLKDEIAHHFKVHEQDHQVRLLVYQVDGGVLGAGPTMLFTMEPARGLEGVTIRYGIAIGESGERVPIKVYPEKVQTEQPLPRSPSIHIESVFPDPLMRSKAAGWNVLMKAPDTDHALEAKLYNVLGRMVWDASWRISPAEKKQFFIPAQAWPAGIYILQVTSAAGSTSRLLHLR